MYILNLVFYTWLVNSLRNQNSCNPVNQKGIHKNMFKCKKREGFYYLFGLVKNSPCERFIFSFQIFFMTVREASFSHCIYYLAGHVVLLAREPHYVTLVEGPAL